MKKRKFWMVSAFLASLWACGSPEQAALDQFFRAAKTSDTATLAYMSAVSPPAQVESWKVVEVTSRTTEPYTLPELAAKLEEAKKERDANNEARKKFFEANEDAVNTIVPKLAKEPDYKFSGKLAPIQQEWATLTEERKQKEGAYQELKRTVDRESSIASKSVARQLDVAGLKGAIAVTEMLLNLKPKDGAELPFKVQLRKYALSEKDSERVEPSRWVIVNIEGATPEARALASASAKGSKPTAEAAASDPAKVADAKSADESKEPVRMESDYVPKELRGLAKVQILAPATKVEGDEVVSAIHVRNVSKDWITGFTVTEHWYDKQGNAVSSESRTHRERFMPGEIIELGLRTKKSPNFFQNQYEFKHANGEVHATTVGNFPKPSGG